MRTELAREVRGAVEKDSSECEGLYGSKGWLWRWCGVGEGTCTELAKIGTSATAPPGFC